MSDSSKDSNKTVKDILDSIKTPSTIFVVGAAALMWGFAQNAGKDVYRKVSTYWTETTNEIKKAPVGAQDSDFSVA